MMRRILLLTCTCASWLLLASAAVTVDAGLNDVVDPSASSCSNNNNNEAQPLLAVANETCGAPQSQSELGSSSMMTEEEEQKKQILEEKRKKELEEFWKPRESDLLELEGGEDEDLDDEEEDSDDYEDYYDEDEGLYDAAGHEILTPQTLRPTVADLHVPQIVKEREEYFDDDDDEEEDSDDGEDDYYDNEDDDDDDDDKHDDDDEHMSPSNYVGQDLGEPQYAETAEVAKLIEEARDYVQNTVMVDDSYSLVRKFCKNKDRSCALWASQGECQANPAYMNISCAPFCRTCEQLHVATRCKLDPNAVDALYPGDLNRMFERIVTDPHYQQFKPIVLSRPDFAPGDTEETADYQLGIWLMQFDNFSTPEECDRLIEMGALEGFKRSADVGKELEDGSFDDDVNEGRTSTNAWCFDKCQNDTLAMSVIRKMENVSGIVHTNAEHLQLLRYEVGQFYNSHNDYIPYQLNRPPGVRILTFFLYLSDVEEGGETGFPRLGLRVKPKKGRAILWPSVFDEHPNRNDIRSDHEALPVLRGVKYGANAWIHQRDVKGALSLNCL